MAGKLPGRALDSNTSITVNNISFGSNLSINTSAISIGNSTVNTVLRSNSATFSGHLMPSANVTYDLGNSSMRWKDLWLSGTTINLGGATLKTDTDSGAVAIIPKPTANNPHPMAVVVSPMGGIVAAETTDGVVSGQSIAAAARSNKAAAVPIDIMTSAPSNGQMLVWSSSSNTFIAHSSVPSINVTGTATLKAVSANGSTGTAGQVLASNGTSTYWTNTFGGATLEITSQTFSGNGTATSFTLSESTTNVETFVFLNGVAQVPGTDYSISGTTLTFVTPPPSDNEIEVRVLEISDVNGIDITLSTFVGNASNTVFTLDTALGSNTSTFVYLNGVSQVPEVDYTVSGDTLTFVTAPADQEQIRAITLSLIGDYTSDSFAANSTVNNNFTLSTPTVTTKAVVFINGVAQAPSIDYYVSGRTLVLNNNAAANDVVQVRSFYEEPSASGANTTIQFNDSGILKGSDGLTFDETTNNVTIGNTLNVASIKFTASRPPINATAPGVAGTLAWDTNYIYICVGTNTWKRVALSTWS